MAPSSNAEPPDPDDAPPHLDPLRVTPLTVGRRTSPRPASRTELHTAHARPSTRRPAGSLRILAGDVERNPGMDENTPPPRRSWFASVARELAGFWDTTPAGNARWSARWETSGGGDTPHNAHEAGHVRTTVSPGTADNARTTDGNSANTSAPAGRTRATNTTAATTGRVGLRRPRGQRLHRGPPRRRLR